MLESGADSLAADHNLITYAPQTAASEKGTGYLQANKNLVQVSNPVPNNLFTGTLQVTLGFTTTHIRVLGVDE